MEHIPAHMESKTRRFDGTGVLAVLAVTFVVLPPSSPAGSVFPALSAQPSAWPATNSAPNDQAFRPAKLE
jgi:hypothetical protein